MARMGVGGYGFRSTMSSKDLENLPNDIVKKAKRSQKKQKKQAQEVRSLYKEKIRNLKKKIEKEFSKVEKIDHGKVKLFGRGDQVSKDLILVKYVLATKENQKKIFKGVLEFVREAIRRVGLDEFFIVRNFGDQEPKSDLGVELMFLKQNHTWERIKNKPYIIQPGEEGEGPAEPGGGAPGGPPSPGGGFGEAPPEGPPEGGEPEAGGEPEPEAGGGGEAGGEET